MVHPSESHTLKNTERNLLPSRLPEALCRPQCLSCRCTPNMGILSFPYTNCCFKKKMVTFIHYKHPYRNSDLLNECWKKIFSFRTSYPQNCLSIPLLCVAWIIFVPEPSSSPSYETWCE